MKKKHYDANLEKGQNITVTGPVVPVCSSGLNDTGSEKGGTNSAANQTPPLKPVLSTLQQEARPPPRRSHPSISQIKIDHREKRLSLENQFLQQ